MEATLQFFNGIRIGQFIQHMNQISIRFQVVCFSRFNKTVMDTAGISTFKGVTEQPGFSPDNKRANSIFSQNITDV